MATWAMTAGGIFIPVGVGLLVFSASIGNVSTHLTILGWAFLVLGFVFWFFSFKASIDEEKQRKRDDRERHNEIFSLLTDIGKQLGDMNRKIKREQV